LKIPTRIIQIAGRRVKRVLVAAKLQRVLLVVRLGLVALEVANAGECRVTDAVVT